MTLWVQKSFALMLVVLALLTAASAQSIFLQESQVRAAFLYNIAKFVEWLPDAFPSPGAPIVIGLLGDDPGSRNLEAALGGNSEGKSWTAIRSWSGGTRARKKLGNPTSCL